MLVRILIAAALLIALNFIPAEGWIRFGLYLIPYLVIGYDILLKALKGIRNRQVFDECFLMAVANSGSHCPWPYMRKAETIPRRLPLCCFTRSASYSRVMRLAKAAAISVN